MLEKKEYKIGTTFVVSERKESAGKKHSKLEI